MSKFEPLFALIVHIPDTASLGILKELSEIFPFLSEKVSFTLTSFPSGSIKIMVSITLGDVFPKIKIGSPGR